jgi:hypothetical protein
MEVSTAHRRRRFVVGIMLALALVASVATPAWAHYIKQTPWVYRSAQICTLAGAEISHGDFQKGYNWGQTQAWTRNYSVPPPFWDCKFPAFQPIGYIALQRALYWWNGSSWIECWRSAWTYNTSRTYAISRGTHWTAPPCSGRSGYYTADSGSYVRYNGEWNGDWINAGGWHYLPTHSSKEAIMMYGDERPPAPPTSPEPSGGPPADEPPTPDQLAAQGTPQLIRDDEGNVVEERYSEIIDPITGQSGPYEHDDGGGHEL